MTGELKTLLVDCRAMFQAIITQASVEYYKSREKCKPLVSAGRGWVRVNGTDRFALKRLADRLTAAIESRALCSFQRGDPGAGAGAPPPDSSEGR